MPPKMRLGGIAHAARGLWAAGVAYAVAAVCPEYVAEAAEHFLRSHGCEEFIRIGNVNGAPNLMIIGDAKEVGHQGYDDILRDIRKSILLPEVASISKFENVSIFPGAYPISEIAAHIGSESKVTVDIAYGIDDFSELSPLTPHLQKLAISTSSKLFQRVAKTEVDGLLEAGKKLGASYVLLKENRGGSRLFDLKNGVVEQIPAVLSKTQNSVGVGDAFTAIFASLSDDASDAAWRGMQVATSYSQTTFPDDLRRDVQRDLNLSLDVVKSLGGVNLPWHDRQKMNIYFAAPDFSYIDKPEIDIAIEALIYHNFKVRRPIQENGEAAPKSTSEDLLKFYELDLKLLQQCVAVFAVPITRDPGTVFEMGVAVQMGLPVVTFDPRNENNNTMIMCGSQTHSDDLDACLNGLYTTLGKIWRERN